MVEFKVLITTSGLGSRLGDLTKYTNKSLIRIGKKPAISYIIENYPKDTKFVITLGYCGNQVRDFLEMTYPDRIFEFVEVDNFDGEGSSLGYSMLKSKDKLRCPFVFHAADTIVTEEIPKPEFNWVIGCNKNNTSQYRMIDDKGNFKIYDKGQIDGSNFCYIGVCGIKDFEEFWNILDRLYNKNPLFRELSDCDVINNMVADFEIIKFRTWFDVGSSSELKFARDNISDKFEILDKAEESIFIFDDFVIKFFYDKETCLNRVKRCQNLQPLTPKLLDSRENFYKYKFSEGQLFSDVVNEELFLSFLIWSKENLWIKKPKNDDFKKKCKNFYFDKTIERIEKYFSQENENDCPSFINGVSVPKVKTLIQTIDEDWLCTDQPYQYHGDYILDNIIYRNDEGFILLDWRQDFSGDLINGDIYYDLAKLNHNLIFNHSIINKKLYTIEKQRDKIKCDLLCSNRLINCQKILHKFILENGFDLDKVEILTSIIWINMAPLHCQPLNVFLFNFGKFNLNKKINEKYSR